MPTILRSTPFDDVKPAKYTTGEAPAAAPATMKAWVTHGPTKVEEDPEQKMKLETQWAVPKPGPGQVRIRVEAVSLNPVDAKRALPVVPGLPFPATMGVDAAGVVESVGAGDVHGFKVGDRVATHNAIFREEGTFAEYTVSEAGAIAHVPDAVSFEDAAAAPCAGYTAYLGLFEKCRVQKGNRVVVLGAAGGVGSYSVQLAKAAGCKVAATCSAASAEYVKNLGADLVVDYKGLTVAQQFEALAAGGFGGVDAVWDTVGGFGNAEVLCAALDAVSFGSHLCSVGPLAASGDVAMKVFVKQASLGCIFIPQMPMEAEAAAAVQSVGNTVQALIAGKQIGGNVTERVVGLEKLRDVMVKQVKQGAQGKAVVVVRGA